MVNTPEVWKEEVQVNPDEIGNQNNSDIIQLTNGNTIVFYTDDSDAGAGSPGGTDILGQMYDPLGSPIGEPFLANATFNSEEEADFDAIALPDGGFAIAYSQINDDGTASIVADEFSVDGETITHEEGRFITQNSGPGQTFSEVTVAGFENGSYAVVYNEHAIGEEGESNVAQATIKIVDREASTVGEPIDIAEPGRPINAAPVDITVLSNGNIAVVTARGGAIEVSIFDPTGERIFREFIDSTFQDGTRDSAPRIEALDDRFVVVWENEDENDRDVFQQLFENDGQPIGDRETAGDSGLDDANAQPDVFALADGGYVVIFDNNLDNDISLQRFDANGEEVGAQVVVRAASSDQFKPTGVGLEDGRFVVTWTIDNGDGEVRMEYYDARDFPNAPVYEPDRWVVGTNRDDVIDVDTPLGDTFYGGGEGNDTIDWEDASALVRNATFDLGEGTARQGNRTIVMADFENLTGTANSDTIRGDDDDNILTGLAGDDLIEGNGGDDTIDAGAGNDTVRGGRGVDDISGGEGDDLFEVLSGEFIDDIDGGEGDDTLDVSGLVEDGNVFDFTTGEMTQVVGEEASGSALTVETIVTNVENFVDGSGDSRILSSGTGTYQGRGGNDTFLAGLLGDETLNGGAGNDSLDASLFEGDLSVDLVTGQTAVTGVRFLNIENIVTGIGNDTIVGTDDANLLIGNSGRDSISGAGGDDTILGGRGRDEMLGGAGDDLYLVDDRRDRVIEERDEGIDTVEASVNIRLGANIENVTLVDPGNVLVPLNLAAKGNGADNAMTGSEGDNLLQGGGGDDTLIGNDGDDRLAAGSGQDVLEGNAGSDNLDGGAGEDRLDGGIGTDTLNGGEDDDALFGGAGADTFVFRGNFGEDTIADFEDGTDEIDLSALRNSANPIELEQLLITQEGVNVRIALDFDQNGVADQLDLDNDGTADSSSIVVELTQVARFSEADFIL